MLGRQPNLRFFRYFLLNLNFLLVFFTIRLGSIRSRLALVIFLVRANKIIEVSKIDYIRLVSLRRASGILRRVGAIGRYSIYRSSP